MFSVGGINFANGVYHNGLVNGAEVHIMQSSQNADDLISDFEAVFRAGMDPNNVIGQIMHDRHLTEADFTDMDIARVNRKIEAIYKAKNQTDKRSY